MVQNIENKFELKLDKESGKVFASRTLTDEYTESEALKLISDTIDYYKGMKDYVVNFESLLHENLLKAREENPDKDEKFFEKLESGWTNKFKIDKEIEIPKMEREIKQYVKLAEQLNFPIDLFEEQDKLYDDKRGDM